MLSLLSASTADVPKTKEISPGVFMPYVNLGGVHSHPSNYSLWLELGGTGLDSALMYGDDVQVEVGTAIAASGIARKDLFITSKIPCCPAGFSTYCAWYKQEYPRPLPGDMLAEMDNRLLGLDYVDLMLLHWPCDTMEETLAM